jgi:hypothetical protein
MGASVRRGNATEGGFYTVNVNGNCGWFQIVISSGFDAPEKR